MKNVCMTPEESHGLTEDIVESFLCLQHQLCGGYPKTRGYSYAYNVSDTLLSFQSSALFTRSGHDIEDVEVTVKIQYIFQNV